MRNISKPLTSPLAERLRKKTTRNQGHEEVGFRQSSEYQKQSGFRQSLPHEIQISEEHWVSDSQASFHSCSDPFVKSLCDCFLHLSANQGGEIYPLYSNSQLIIMISILLDTVVIFCPRCHMTLQTDVRFQSHAVLAFQEAAKAYIWWNSSRTPTFVQFMPSEWR